MQNNQGFFLILLIIVPIGIVIWMMSRRRNAKMKGVDDMAVPEKKDEV